MTRVCFQILTWHRVPHNPVFTLNPTAPAESKGGLLPTVGGKRMSGWKGHQLTLVGLDLNLSDIFTGVES